jgi:hypothetical protein
MKIQEEQVKCIKNMIIRGFVAHSEIIPRLEHAGITRVNADQIANLVVKYKAGFTSTFAERILKFLGNAVSNIFAFIFSLCCAGVLAELTIAKIFSDTIIKSQINGFGDNLLFWLGIKKLSLSAIDMLSAVMKIMSSTYEVVKAIIIGAIGGFIIWKILTGLIYFLYKRQQLSGDVKRLLKRYEYR